MLTNDVIKNYGEYINPLVTDILKSLGVQKRYIKAEGHTLTYEDAEGNQGDILDVACGYGSLIFGHNHPEIVAVIEDYLKNKKPIHTQFSYHPYTALLAKELAQIAKKSVNDDYIIRFANSGTEAVDLAIKHCEFKRVLKMQEMTEQLDKDLLKIERLYYEGKCSIPGDIFSETELREFIFDEYLTPSQLKTNLTRLNAKALSSRPVIFALKKAFHGKSLGACQLTHSKDYRRAFMFFGLLTFFVDPVDVLEMEMIINDLKEIFYTIEIIDNKAVLIQNTFPRITAIIAEPIQGEGGIQVIDHMVLKDLKMISEENHAPLIFDEIQCGMGRTGTFFASQPSGVSADIYLIAKSIGGGLLKNSCVFIKKKAYESSFGIIHTSTFAEDDLSAAVGLKVIELLEKDGGAAYQKAHDIGEKLISRLNDLRAKYPEVIKEVRGKGLMIGVEFYNFKYADSAVFRNVNKWNVQGYMLFSYLHEVEGIRALPTASAPSTLRLEPGTTLKDSEIDFLIKGIENLCKVIQNNDGYHLIHHITTQNRKNKVKNISNYRTNTYKKEIEKYKQKSFVPKIGFIGHPLNLESIRNTVPELENLTLDERRGMYENSTTIRSNAPLIPIRIKSQFGREIDIIFYIVNRTTEQIIHDINSPKLKELQNAFFEIAKEAKENGCSVLGFGGFTSIASINCKALPEIPGLAYTSGNSLTTGLGHQAMLQGARLKFNKLSDCTALVVGGAGNIGQVYASLLTEDVSKVILLGSQRKGSFKRLATAYDRIYKDIASYIFINDFTEIKGMGEKLINLPEIFKLVNTWKEQNELPETAGKMLSEIILSKYTQDPFLVCTDDQETIKTSNLIACTANAPEPFIGNDLISENSVICDLGVPANIKDEVIKRDDIEFMQGGLAQLPHNQIIPGNFMNVTPCHAYGCLTETIVMGLLGMNHHYSYGDITREQVKEITALADIQGFKIAQEYRRGEKF